MQEQDLIKIDWMRCVLPEWKSHGCAASYNGKIWLSLLLSKSHALWIAYRYPDRRLGDWEFVLGGQPYTSAEFRDLETICAKVDAFIEAELKRIKIEAEYPMSAAEALEFIKTHPGEHKFDVFSTAPEGASWWRAVSGRT